jgi:hypothetical protein
MNLKSKGTIEVLALLICATGASAHQNRRRPEQRAACSPDTFSLCSSYTPESAAANRDGPLAT